MSSLILPALALLMYACGSVENKLAGGQLNRAFTGRRFPGGTSDASIARQILHEAEYCPLVTQFALDDLAGYAGSNVQLFIDGPKGNSTGIPYFYLNRNDPSFKDMKIDGKVALFLTEGVIKGRCDKFPLGMKDEDCPRVELFGNMEEVSRLSQEFHDARGWFQDNFEGFKHLGLRELEYVLYKLNIEEILIQKGGLHIGVSVEDYFAATPAEWVGK